jgi:hypothetical protein
VANNTATVDNAVYPATDWNNLPKEIDLSFVIKTSDLREITRNDFLAAIATCQYKMSDTVYENDDYRYIGGGDNRYFKTLKTITREQGKELLEKLGIAGTFEISHIRSSSISVTGINYCSIGVDKNNPYILHINRGNQTYDVQVRSKYANTFINFDDIPRTIYLDFDISENQETDITEAEYKMMDLVVNQELADSFLNENYIIWIRKNGGRTTYTKFLRHDYTVTQIDAIVSAFGFKDTPWVLLEAADGDFLIDIYANDWKKHRLSLGSNAESGFLYNSYTKSFNFQIVKGSSTKNAVINPVRTSDSTAVQGAVAEIFAYFHISGSDIIYGHYSRELTKAEYDDYVVWLKKRFGAAVEYRHWVDDAPPKYELTVTLSSSWYFWLNEYTGSESTQTGALQIRG